jgi:hypothetical protein
MMDLKYKNWQQITIEVYDKIRDLDVDIKSEEEALDVNVKLLSILCGVDEETIINLPLTEFTILVGKTDFLKEMPKYTVEQKYEIGKGRVFEVQMNLREMTTAQFIDFQTLIKNQEKNTANILACFLIPKGKKYAEDYDVIEVAEYLYKNMSIATARSVMFFFILQYQTLQKVMLNYSIKELKKSLKKEKNEEMKMKLEEALHQLMQVKHLISTGVGGI